MNRYLVLVIFLVLVVGGGAAIGSMNLPGPWYEGLAKPPFNPPNWVFGPAWTILYVLIAVAGWRTFERDRGGPAMKAWWAQMLLNFAWSPVFFTLQSVGGALFVVVLMLAAILAFIGLAWVRDRIAASLFLPYAAWVSFATLLNASILWLN
ncbi:MAG: tryptophan-rich sensory protein [Mesorhizobium sp.]|nr:TspO/MBR family protein [Mesorhizobium sp.]MCO5160217.1 tryptophan-rich sensory protein [Mesorhizobium sp.]